jgi:hypothetical protein
MCTPSPPAAPDYKAAAATTASGNQNAALAAQMGNMTNQSGPQQYSYDKATGKFTALYQTDAQGNQVLDNQGKPIASATGVSYQNPAKADKFGNMPFDQSKLTPEQKATYATTGTLPSKFDVTYLPQQWTQQQTLGANDQQLFNQSQATQLGMSGLALKGLDEVEKAVNNNIKAGTLNYGPSADSRIQTDLGIDPQLLNQQTTDALYKANTQYLDPQFAQSQAAMESQLANQGITRGSKAYNDAMLNFNNQKQQAYSDARNSAIGGGTAAAQGLFGMGLQKAGFGNSAIEQLYSQRQRSAELNNQTVGQDLQIQQAVQQNPLNILQALRTGAQLNTANLPQVGVSQPGQLANWQGADMLGAATAQGQYDQSVYNAQAAANAQMMSAGIGAAGALGGAGIKAASDRRLKKNIKRIGTHVLGIGLYTWDYLWGQPFSGVMADEVEQVMPEAIVMHPSGFKMVNYSMLGLL